jgi:hypothetical protein
MRFAVRLVRCCSLLAIALFAQLLIGSVACAAEPETVSFASILRSSYQLRDYPMSRNWTTRMYSSYDRTGGNADFDQYLREDGNVKTIVDTDGPGVVVRIWSANPGGTIRIYLDGSSTPVVEKRFDEYFKSLIADPDGGALSGWVSGGAWTYLPIPFAKHCRVTLDNPGKIYYQVNVARFAPGTLVATYSPSRSANEQTALREAAARFLSAAPLQADTADVKELSSDFNIAGGATATVKPIAGGGVIESLTLSAPLASDAQLRRMVLRVWFDDHKTPDIEAPVSDFYGNSFGHRPFKSLFLEQTASGDMVCRFPMPFAKQARITVENGNPEPVSVRVATGIRTARFVGGSHLYLHATFRQEVSERSKPQPWVSVAGQRGFLAGIVQSMSGTQLGFLEGDEQIRVDDEQIAACDVNGTVIAPWNGTGTEDFFNCGWYFGKPCALPLHGCLVIDPGATVSAYRYFAGDAPVFQRSLDANLENGGANNSPRVAYASVAFWYGDGENVPPSQPLSASAMRLPENPVPMLKLVAPGLTVIEGEKQVKGSAASAGQVNAQSMDAFADSMWSGASHLFWNGTMGVGDTLDVPFAVSTAGTYSVTGYFTKARDYGQVSVSINGGGAMAFDGYDTGVVNSGPVSLGTVTLPAGTSHFTVKVTGKAEKASGYFFGLDAIVLKAVRDQP